MKNKNLLFLVLSLGICSGTILIDRFVIPLNDWLVIVLMLLAVVFLIVFTVKSYQLRKDNNV